MMKIGRLVKRHIREVFEYCEAHDSAEFNRLQDRHYSKKTFDINYPFCTAVEKIAQTDQVRYWQEEYSVHGVRVKVTSQWFNPPTSKSLPFFHRYLKEREIATDESTAPATEGAEGALMKAAERAARGRYKGNAIGNAQNLLVRNLLSRIGDEQFSAAHWQGVIESFAGRCAYCGIHGELVMDHVVPINKQTLGEHRIGNLVPACRSCNAKKAGQDFREFLSQDLIRISAIEAHMTKHAYVPNSENEKLRSIVELAHQDVRQLADRYVAIINTVLKDEQSGVVGPTQRRDELKLDRSDNDLTTPPGAGALVDLPRL